MQSVQPPRGLAMVLVGALAFGGLCQAPATAQTKAAAIELHNLTDEFLPRIDSYSETALYKYFTRHSTTRFVDRTAVSEMLLRRRDRVVLFPGDPVLASDFGHDLGVDYIVTGNILDYESHGDVHRMMVEMMIIGVDERDYVMRKVYDSEYREQTGYKKHREILDQIIQNMAVDFEAYVGRAETARQQRAEAKRLREEKARLAWQRAEAQRRAEERAANQRAADERATAEALAQSAAANARAAAANAEAAADNVEAAHALGEIAKQFKLAKTPENDDASWIVVRVHEVKLLKSNWGVSDFDAEFQMAIMAPQLDGDASYYLYPGDGPTPLGEGESLPITDAGFSIEMAPGDGEMVLRLCGIDSDTPDTQFGLALEGVLYTVAEAASTIARSRGLSTGKTRLFGLAIGVAGSLISKFIQDNDIIGQAEIVIDHRGGGLADGRRHVVRSPDETIEFVFDVQVGSRA